MFRSKRELLANLILVFGACGVMSSGVVPVAVAAEACSGIFRDGFEFGDTTGWGGSPGSCVSLPGGVRMDFVTVPGGTFSMGSPTGGRGRYSDEDLHAVTLTRSHEMGRTEVTKAQWQAVFGNDPSLSSCFRSDCPVETVNWWESAEYANALSFQEGLELCYWLTGCTGTPGVDFRCTSATFAGLSCTGYRLPTEAEWERAARAGTTTRFSHGDVLETDDFCEVPSLHEQYMWWCGNNWLSGTKATAFKLPNGYGLYDMHGNVSEWTSDWYQGNLGTGSVTDPTGPASGSYRVLRGGYWYSNALNTRSAYRDFYSPGYRYYNVGLRLARSQ